MRQYIVPYGTYRNSTCRRQMITEDERGWEHIGIPMKFRHEPGQVVFDLPELGQHTEANLRNVGYTDADIAVMQEKGVF